jgi:hypothetical protein
MHMHVTHHPRSLVRGSSEFTIVSRISPRASLDTRRAPTSLLPRLYRPRVHSLFSEAVDVHVEDGALEGAERRRSHAQDAEGWLGGWS